MKKWFVLFSLLFLSLFLFASPCFEEVETIVLATISSRASIPELTLNGVKMKGDDDLIIPSSVEYENSDASFYLENLSTKPKKLSLWESALFNMTQRNPSMIKTKEILREADYKKGEVVTNGRIKITALSEVKTLDIVMSSDLSSIDIDAELDLTLKIKNKNYIIKGTLHIDGSSDRILSVYSNNISVNDTYYKVSLKYKLTKA